MLSKMAKFWLSKSIFYLKNDPNLSHFFFSEEYHFRSTFFVINIFWKLQFLKLFCFLKWCLIFFDDFYLKTDLKTQKLFNGLIVGFGLKRKPGRMWDNVCEKWGHTNSHVYAFLSVRHILRPRNRVIQLWSLRLFFIKYTVVFCVCTRVGGSGGPLCPPNSFFHYSRSSNCIWRNLLLCHQTPSGLR